MPISKLIFNGQTQMDVTGNTADESTTLYGYEGTAADGTQYTGEVAAKTSSDVTVSGATVTVPAGAYASAVTKTVATGTVTAPASITGSSATVSTGTNTLTLSKTVSVTPSVTTAGYVSSGTAGNSSVSLTASVTTKATATINTSTTDQTIASGTYLTGTQTIKAVTVSNTLAASNILNGVTIKVGDANDDDRIASVTGNVQFVTYYTGSSTPSSSLGSNGDIYLKTT